jgi:hypothetical protein
MNQVQLLGYIQNPALLAGVSVVELERLVDEFPYCPTTHLLFTKALFEQKSIRYPGQLKKSAAFIPDRSILYWLINGATTDNPVVDITITASTTSEEKTQQSSGFYEDVTKVSPAESYEELMARLEKLSLFSFQNLELFELKLLDLEKEHINRINEIVQEYLDKRIQQQFAEETESSKSDTEKTDLTASEPKIAGEEQMVQETLSKSDLIERFISNTPGITRPKKEFYNPVNMAHKSTVDSEDLVSETLAEVHLAQGNIEKSIKIYERLCLLIPEKSAYFAARIEKIKKENNLL